MLMNYYFCEKYKTFRSAQFPADQIIEELFKESAGSNFTQPLKIDVKLFFESFFIFYKNI